MNNNETVLEILKLVKKKTNLRQKEIAKRLGYSESYLSEAIKSPTDKVIRRLKEEFAEELGIAVLKKQDSEVMKDILQLKATVKTLVTEVSILKSKTEGKPIQDVQQELNQSNMKNLTEMIVQ